MSSDVPAVKQQARSILDAIRDGDLRTVRDASFADLVAAARLAPEEVPAGERAPLAISQTGEGFVVVPRAFKQHLVGVPFVIVDVDTNESSDRPGTYFTSLKIRTEHAVHAIRPGCDAFILNDGSTGIHKQLRDLRLSGGATLPIWCEKGLRVSKYTVTTDQVDPETGEKVIDPETGKAKKIPVIDPTTGGEVKGETFYLDDAL